MMDWSEERYVKIYRRDTGEIAALSWDASSVFWALQRKVDHLGKTKLGRRPERALAGLLRCPRDVAKKGLTELVEDGFVTLENGVLTIPSFVAAQTARQSAAARKRNERDRKKSEMEHCHTKSHDVTKSHTGSRRVTPGHAMSHDVTNRDQMSQNVTNSHEESREVTNVTTRLEQTRIDKKAAAGRAGIPVAKPMPKQQANGTPSSATAAARLVAELGELVAAGGGLEQVHADLGQCLSTVPRFAECLPTGPLLRKFLQDMLRGYDGVGNGRPMSRQFIERAVNDAARDLKPDHTDEQSLRKMLASKFRLQAKDQRTAGNATASAGRRRYGQIDTRGHQPRPPGCDF